MSFAMNRVNQGGFELVNLENLRNGTIASILPGFGAALHAFTLRTAHGDLNVIDHYPDLNTLEETLEQRFKSCKLSPFVCRIPSGRYEFHGSVFTLESRPEPGSALHGLLYNKRFGISDEYCDDNEVSVTLKYNYKRDDAGYPFRYRCEVKYTLFEEDVLGVQTTIINLDETAIPIADGWHPYFAPGENLDEWMLRISSTAKIQFSQSLIPTGEMIRTTAFCEEEAIAGRTIDDCFLVEHRDNYAACTLFNPANGISVSFFPINHIHMSSYSFPRNGKASRLKISQHRQTALITKWA